MKRYKVLFIERRDNFAARLILDGASAVETRAGDGLHEQVPDRVAYDRDGDSGVLVVDGDTRRWEPTGAPRPERQPSLFDGGVVEGADA